MDFLGGLIAIYILYLVLKWGLILFGVYIVLLLIVAIYRAISNSITGSKNTGSDNKYVNYKPDTQSNYSFSNSDFIDNELDDVIDVDEEDVQVDYDRIEEEDRMAEPYCCPECGEPYDGIYCENCGHSNDNPGYEEVSEDDQWVENMTAIAMFAAEERRREGEREEKLFGGIGSGKEFDDDY